MKERELYLCAIGTTLSDKINDYIVGNLIGDDIFSFPNGSYNNMELAYNRKLGSSITCVKAIKKVDDIELGDFHR